MHIAPLDDEAPMPDAPEPWDIAAAREHGVSDWAAVLLLGAGAALVAILPSLRLVVLTALRLSIAALLAAASLVAPSLAAEACAWGARGFVLLALLSIAAHVEGATLGPLVDRLVGKDKA